MGVAFDHCRDRPENIDAILNGLDRYNPETTTVFQEYVDKQCEGQTYDCYANLALLKLYQFNPHLARDETTTNILVKSLTVFPAPDFSLGLSLLPPYVLSPKAAAAAGLPAQGTLAEAVQHLNVLHTQLANAQYADFWATLEGDDLYADLTADVVGFEDTIRVQIAAAVSQCMQEADRDVLEGWLNMRAAKFETFVTDVCGWAIEGDRVKVPLNNENEARSVVQRETVKFGQFGRIVKRAYEQPA